ncbi:MAG: hypothetical protein GXP06_10980 [Alphaproteobacteria bacterium]|nr:hypothetical protein [Alphaproteobacteria bacterium]
MSDAVTTKLPVWFWIVAIVAILWNLMGVASYISTVMISPEAIAAMPEAEQALYNNTPIWATSAFAIAVFAGIAGAVLMVLRNCFALPVFGLSLAGIIIQMSYWLLMTNSIDVYGPGGVTMPIMVITIGAFLVWFSSMAKAKGWLR